MKYNLLKTLLTSSILLPTLAFSNIINIDDENSIKKRIVIFNGGAFFDEEKKIYNIKKMENNIVYSNISPNLIKGSVVVTFPKGINIMEQNYKFNTVTFDEVLKYYIGKEISFKRYIENNKEFIIQKGIILSASPTILIQTKDGIFNIDKNDISFEKLPEEMTIKPSIEWRIDSKSNVNKNKVELKYLSTGFDWNANYVANIVNGKLNINGWIKLHNNSNISLKDYQLDLLAGNVNNPQEITINKMMLSKKEKFESRAFDSEVIEQSFSGYHVYKIPFKVDISKNSIKEINFLTADVKDYDRINMLTLPSYIHDTLKLKFQQTIKIKNDKHSGIYKPLPAGLIRVYEKDKDGNSFFIGADNIPNTPKNDDIKISIGENFDSILKIKKIEEVNKKHYKLLKNNIELSNNSDKIEKYEIKSPIPQFNELNGYIKFENNCENNKDFSCKYEKINKSFGVYKLSLKPDSKINFDYKFEFTY